MIYVIATIELKPGQRENFLAEFHKIVPLVLEESGCIEYGPAIDVETEIKAQPDTRDNVVTIIEKWESLDHLEDHLVADHMMKYRLQVKEMIVGTQLSILEPA